MRTQMEARAHWQAWPRGAPHRLGRGAAACAPLGRARTRPALAGPAETNWGHPIDGRTLHLTGIAPPPGLVRPAPPGVRDGIAGGQGYRFALAFRGRGSQAGRLPVWLRTQFRVTPNEAAFRLIYPAIPI